MLVKEAVVLLRNHGYRADACPVFTGLINVFLPASGEREIFQRIRLRACDVFSFLNGK